MTRRSIQERLRQLEARKQMLVARLSKEQRAQDTRRKILIGALVLDRIERNGFDVLGRASRPGVLDLARVAAFSR